MSSVICTRNLASILCGARRISSRVGWLAIVAWAQSMSVRLHCILATTIEFTTTIVHNSPDLSYCEVGQSRLIPQHRTVCGWQVVSAES